MRQLKYLKLFEAFESVKLTKTLGYIDKDSRENFISRLKNICSKLSFPVSQLNDEMFQYLPYSKALKVNAKLEEKPCIATSKSSFGGHGIEGEKCEGGKLKRMWGSRVRIVECPNCGGTGIEPPKEELKIIKFWFSKEGKMIATTGCDGTQKAPTSNFSIAGYKVKSVINSNQSDWRTRLQSLEQLTPVLLRPNSGDDAVKATFYKQRDELFCIQDRYEGGTPSGRDWQRHGRYSWNVSGRDFYTISILEPSKEEETEKQTEIDPLTYNYLVSFGWRGDMGLDKRRNVEEYIKDAHFALVFDYEKLKQSDVKKVPVIRSEREELKSGSRLTVTDEMVRKENIERYMNKIAEKSDLVSDIKNVKSVTNRVIGGNYALFVICPRSRFEDNFTRIITKYTQIIKYKQRENSNEEELDYVLNDLKRTIKQYYETTSSDISDIRKVLTYCRTQLSKDPEKKVYLDLLNTLEDVSRQINQKIMSLPFDCIEDLEIVKAKVLNIRNLMNSDTYALSNLRYFLDSVINGRDTRSYGYLTDEWRLKDENLEETIRGLETFKKILTRL